MLRHLIKYQFVAYLAGFLATLPGISTATVYTASGTNGFGGAIGESQMTWTDDGTTVSVSFTKGGGQFNDRFVLYLDTGASGRNSIDTTVNDRGDTLRSAITYMEASTGKTLTFTSGFQASHAIAIDTGFGGLWAIPPTGSIGNNGLNFVTGVGNPTSNTQTSFNFSFTLANLGLTPNSGATIKLLGTYLNPFGGTGSLGFASNEGYGSGFTGSNIGQDNFTFTGSPLSYVTAVPEAPQMLAMLTAFAATAVGATVLRRRVSRAHCAA